MKKFFPIYLTFKPLKKLNTFFIKKVRKHTKIDYNEKKCKDLKKYKKSFFVRRKKKEAKKKKKNKSLLLALLFCLLLALLFSVLFIIAPDYGVLLAVLVPMLLYSVLLTTGSSAVVLSRILTTCSLAVVPSVILSLTTGSLAAVPSVLPSSESLCGRLRLRGSFLASLQHHYSALRPS